MFSQIWFTYLYQPLFNALIWIYSNLADYNLGWAVIYLTIGLRLVLLPLTIVSERDAAKQEKLNKEAAIAARAFANDSVEQNEEYRRIIKKNKISPRAKMAVLLIQILVLVLLYQVFMRGINNDKLSKILYPTIDYPGQISSDFYGFDIGKPRDYIWSGIVGIYLFISIYLEHRGKPTWESSEVVFLVIFPIFCFLALWILPMVKSLFILTTMIFSDIITIFVSLFSPPKKQAS